MPLTEAEKKRKAELIAKLQDKVDIQELAKQAVEEHPVMSGIHAFLNPVAKDWSLNAVSKLPGLMPGDAEQNVAAAKAFSERAAAEHPIANIAGNVASKGAMLAMLGRAAPAAIGAAMRGGVKGLPALIKGGVKGAGIAGLLGAATTPEEEGFYPTAESGKERLSQATNPVNLAMGAGAGMIASQAPAIQEQARLKAIQAMRGKPGVEASALKRPEVADIILNEGILPESKSQSTRSQVLTKAQKYSEPLYSEKSEILQSKADQPYNPQAVIGRVGEALPELTVEQRAAKEGVLKNLQQEIKPDEAKFQAEMAEYEPARAEYEKLVAQRNAAKQAEAQARREWAGPIDQAPKMDIPPAPRAPAEPVMQGQQEWSPEFVAQKKREIGASIYRKDPQTGEPIMRSPQEEEALNIAYRSMGEAEAQQFPEVAGVNKKISDAMMLENLIKSRQAGESMQPTSSIPYLNRFMGSEVYSPEMWKLAQQARGSQAASKAAPAMQVVAPALFEALRRNAGE